MNFDADGQAAHIRRLWSAPSAEERTVQGQMMTPKQKLEMHKRIVRENERKLREWKQKGGKAA